VARAVAVKATSDGHGLVRVHHLPEMSDVYVQEYMIKLSCLDGNEHAASRSLPGRRKHARACQGGVAPEKVRTYISEQRQRSVVPRLCPSSHASICAWLY